MTYIDSEDLKCTYISLTHAVNPMGECEMPQDLFSSILIDSLAEEFDKYPTNIDLYANSMTKNMR